jgi:dimethylargininase
MPVAIVRDVSPSLTACELTHLPRQVIDLERARSQHHQYVKALLSLGCSVEQLPAEADFPDSVFVEDTAVVLDEFAIITRPGAVSRRGEISSIALALEPFRPLKFIEAPATLDGGDVLQLGKTIFIGLSSRSTGAAVEQVRMMTAPFGYRVEGVEVKGCLHLKSAVSRVAENSLLINRHLVRAEPFAGMELIEVDEGEPLAANALFINQSALYPVSYPRTRERLEKRGTALTLVDVSELIKAEGAVTCCSLVFREAASDE